MDEDGLAVRPGLRGVALLGHTLEEEGESGVEDGGQGFEYFGRDAIRPRNATRIAGLDLAVSRKLSVGDDVVASAANAGPGFVLVMR